MKKKRNFDASKQCFQLKNNPVCVNKLEGIPLGKFVHALNWNKMPHVFYNIHKC